VRIIVFIFSLYMLALAGWPCADDISNESDVHTEMTTEHNHDHKSDGCSPLCFCHCCHIHFQLPVTFEETLAEEPLQTIKTFYRCAQTENPVSSLFKPPRA